MLFPTSITITFILSCKSCPNFYELLASQSFRVGDAKTALQDDLTTVLLKTLSKIEATS